MQVETSPHEVAARTTSGRRRVLVAMAAVLVGAGLLVGCGSKKDTAEVDRTSATFPAEVASQGGPVKIERKPMRIVSLSPTATEDLFALDAGEQVVAVDDQSTYPANAPITKLSGLTPNVEAIAGYQPDLVVLSYDANGVVDSLKKLHVPVLVQPSAPTFDAMYDQITELGRATGHGARSTELVDYLRDTIDQTVKSTPKGPKSLRIYHEVDPTYYSVTSRSFVGEVYARFGVQNIADAADRTGSGYPQLSAEYVVNANPDIIFLADTKCCAQTQQSVAARSGWSGISAVASKSVVNLDDDVASRWGPRTVDFVKAVAEAVRASQKA